MNNFKIIPVIDILNSEAVHAIKGKRSEYRPLKSNYFNSSNPYDIIRLLNKKYGFNEFYIADLDSILRRKPNIHLISKLLDNFKIKIMLDPGIIDSRDLNLYSQLNLNKVILGLETIKSFNVIENALKILEPSSITLSIDMYNGKIISNMNELNNQNPIEIMKRVEKMGINNYILLDLYRVGQKIGDIPQIYLEIRQKYNANFIVGGGIKDFNEIMIYKNNFFSGVIMATALYDGTINMEEVKRFNGL